ncbi:MAG: hypothetical protein AAGI91_08010 [Bacteroidota bacterium]
MAYRSSLLLPLVLLLLAGCARTEQMISPSSIVGTWAYVIEGPDSPSSGLFSIEESGDGLVGQISGEALDGTAELTDVVFEENTVSFGFDAGTLGIVSVSADVDGPELSGTVDAAGFVQLPLRATRQTDT